MPQAGRSAIVLGGLSLLLVVVAAWGWNAATEPLPGQADSSKCVEQTVDQGQRVFANQVTVSVYNASDRNGLASRTMGLFTDSGFGEGDTGNAPRDADVVRAQIWTETPRSPAVQLVASRLGPDVRVVRRDQRGAGVMVLVGDEFTKLVKGRRSVRAAEDATICGPPSNG
jgi:hypothetical protein